MTFGKADSTWRKWVIQLRCRIAGRSALPAPPAARVSGFSESPASFIAAERHVHQTDSNTDFPVWPPRVDGRVGSERVTVSNAAPFAGSGPVGHRERMRRKLIERGSDALADYELLEMLLYFAFKRGDTKPLAKALINHCGSFAGVLAARQQDLGAIHGVGSHALAAIKLVQAAAVRLAHAELADRPIFSNWDALIGYLTAVMAREQIEQFRVLYLDTRNRLLADETQSRGTVNHTPVYPREIVKRALELHATALVLVHNHPSGDPKPSRDDIEMTAEIKRSAEALDIVLHDHIIIGLGQHFSFRRDGMV